MKPSLDSICSLALLAAVTAFTCQATTIVVVPVDPPGYGFNSTDAAVPAPGNDGTTLGEQRVNVVQRAGDIWAAYLHSDVPIRVECEFQDFGGTPDGYTLAGASAITVVRNFTNAPLSNTWYPIALANSLAGEDLSTSNDISVTVNIALDTDPALDTWYYGLDGNAPAGTVDLLDVLLHEIGHGLGFASYADIQSGSFLQRIPDVFSLGLFDLEYQSGWVDLNKREVQLSAVNDPDLVWTGTYSTTASPHILEAKRGMLVTSPPSLAGEYAYEAALFGPAVPEGGIAGILVPVVDAAEPFTDACDPITNAGQLAGNIAYIDRGSCNFDAKVLAVQDAGAIAAVIANNVGGGPVFMSGALEVAIPAVSIALEDGALLTSETGVEVTLGVPSSTLAGTNGGFGRMYAPDPIEQGSSVSHWTTDASPDLLMEPFINPVLREDLDLSLTLMKDIGWVVIDIPFPYLTYDLWVAERFDPAEILTAVGDDPDGDSVLNIEEYFFNGDPEAPGTDVLPRMQASDPNLEVVYTRATFFTDLEWKYEISTDMTNWSDAVEGIDFIEEVVTPVGGSAEEVRLQIIQPDPGGRVFIRLRITEVTGP